MSQNHLIGLSCSKCKSRTAITTRNKKQVAEKLKLSKYCKVCRVRTEHKEYKV